MNWLTKEREVKRELEKSPPLFRSFLQAVKQRYMPKKWTAMNCGW